MSIVIIIINISSFKKVKLSSLAQMGSCATESNAVHVPGCFSGSRQQVTLRCGCVLRSGLMFVSPTPSISHKPGTWLRPFPCLRTEVWGPIVMQMTGFGLRDRVPGLFSHSATWAFQPAASLLLPAWRGGSDTCTRGGRGAPGRYSALLEMKWQSNMEALLSYQTRTCHLHKDGFSISVYLLIHSFDLFLKVLPCF